MLWDGHHGGERWDNDWSPPPALWCERNRPAVREWLAEFLVAYQPAPEDFVRELLAGLAMRKAAKAGAAGEWKWRAREYVRLLGHYPADIWQRAVDVWSLSSPFFPDDSDLYALMRPLLAERKRDIERLEALLRPRLKERPPPSPEERARGRKGLRKLAIDLERQPDPRSVQTCTDRAAPTQDPREARRRADMAAQAKAFHERRADVPAGGEQTAEAGP